MFSPETLKVNGSRHGADVGCAKTDGPKMVVQLVLYGIIFQQHRHSELVFHAILILSMNENEKKIKV